VIPEVLPPLDLTAWLNGDPDGRRLVLRPGSDTPMSQAEVASRIELAIGPEGGFSSAEHEVMALAGVQACSLGPRILRTETAAPAALAILQARAGDL
jgi:16S rRNA (uracil1498-N3)-methyltransferase